MTELENIKKAFAISGEAQEELQKLSEKFKVDFGYVMSIFMGHGSTTTEAKALIFTKGDLQNESTRQSFYIYVLDDTGPVDMYELMRQKVARLLAGSDTHSKAIEDGMATEDGIVLDYREKVFGKPNENKGMPLEGTSWQRTILAIVADNEAFDGAVLAEITTNNEPAKDIPLVEPFNVYKALINKNKKNPLRYSFGKNSKFNRIPSTVTNAEIANKITTETMDNLERVYTAQFAGKKRTNYLVPIRGYITWMSLDAIKGSRPLILTDQDTEEWIRCGLYEKVPVVYQRADEILAFARLYTTRDGKIGANIRAYMVI
jgi:hypothetical protein